MQTFVTHVNPSITADELDRQRLGKQRVEAIQIARCLLGLTEKEGWKQHPAVLMWKGYEPFLIHCYIPAMMNRWVQYNYKNEKCEAHHKQLSSFVSAVDIQRPHWFFNEYFILSHKSNLLRKNFQHYSKLYKGIPNDLEYIWPEGRIS